MKWHLPVPYKLRRPIALAFATAMPAVAIAWLAHQEKEQALAERDRIASRIERLDVRLQGFQGERKHILRQALQFQALQAQGIVGHVATSSWDLTLQDLGQELALPALRYGSPPTTTTEEGGEFSLQTTRIQLRLQLRHEQQFLDFLGRLHKDVGALVLLRSCRLARLSPATDEATGPPAYLEADCELDWVNARTKLSEAA